MSDAVEVSKGECVRIQGTWTDEDGAIDLTGRTLSIVDSYPKALMGGTVTVTDGPAGEFEVFSPEALAVRMGSGRVIWIRVEMALPGGCPDTTPRIWIEVV